MKHEVYKEMLYLYTIDELSFQDKKLFEEHLRECGECRADLNAAKQLHNALVDNMPRRSSTDTLVGARNRLFDSIKTEKKKDNLWEKLSLWLTGFFTGGRRLAFTGAFSLMFGVVFGALVFSNQAENNAVGGNDIVQLIKQEKFQIANVRLPEMTPASNEIEISFDAVRPVHYKGKLDDGFTRELLATAIVSADNPGVKLRTINTISGSADNRILVDEKVKEALITSLMTDENPGVRKTALTTLSRYKFDSEIRDALIFALTNDLNSGVRVAAINALADKKLHGKSIDENFRNVLEDKARSDDNNLIRLRAASILEEVK